MAKFFGNPYYKANDLDEKYFLLSLALETNS